MCRVLSRGKTKNQSFKEPTSDLFMIDGIWYVVGVYNYYDNTIQGIALNEIYKIENYTVSIHIVSMIDKNDSPIFASLEDDGAFGDLIKAPFINHNLIATFDRESNQFMAILKVKDKVIRKFPLSKDMEIIGINK